MTNKVELTGITKLTKNKKPLTDKDVEEIFKKIDLVESKISQQVKKLYELKLSILQEQVKRSDKFYLSRTTRKQIESVMRKHLVYYREAFDGKDPSWYHKGQGLSLTIENFWINERTRWNKAHGLEWNNSRDPKTKQLMEYRR